jgi:cytochrome c oxidase assembly protein subunit 11
MTATGDRPAAGERRLDLRLTAAACIVFVAAMAGMSFAAVPLYRMFCEATGFGGTTQRATAAPAETTDRFVTVRLDSNVAAGLGWSFQPRERAVRVRLGEVGQVAFLAENRLSATTTGTAAFNVTPTLAGAYFNKLECFCFTDQTLAPGQSAELGVVFFVDPAYADDSDLQTVSTITLSYTFFPTANPSIPRSVAAADAAAVRPAVVGAAVAGAQVTMEQ